MSLLASSTPEKRNTVRILFYGQSIVGQKKWTDAVASDLKRRFPHANIIYDNRAIGGFSSQWLIHTSEHQLYPFQPDLMIFHVYGSHKDYQRIIHRARSRTSAEIAIVTDHLGAKAYDGKTFADESWWTRFMQGFLAKVADRYDCELIEIRRPWKQYLKSNGFPSSKLLKDGIHPNDHGCYLMSSLVSRQLVHRPELMTDKSRALARDYVVGKDVAFEDGKLTLTFEGNAVALLAGQTPGKKGHLDVRIDGRKPSEFKSCYYHTLPGPTVGVGWPAIREVGFNAMPLLEDWTVTLTDFQYVKDGKNTRVHFNFSVEGSKTGPDGKGNSREDFVSDSGRVVIAADDWVLTRSYNFSKKKPREGYTTRFSTRPLFVDRYEPGTYAPTLDNLDRIVALLPNGKHTLELTVEGDMPRIDAIRVYTPPETGAMNIVANPPPPSQR
jgi:hypothetical protein